MKIMKKINTQEIPVKRTFASLWMTVAMVLAFTGCSEEELMQPANGQAGTLHITSVSVDGQQVGGRSRVVADDETQYGYENAPYNQSLNSFGNGDKIKLSYNFGGAGDDAPAPVYATYNNGTWAINGNIAPRAEEESETWRRLEMTATANAHKELIGDPEEEDDDIYDECADGGEEESEYAAAARVLGIVAGEGIESENIRLLTDFLYATIRDGSISIDKNLTSPTLGATTISFKHASRALLRLPIPEGGFNVAGTYVVNGTAHHVTGFATLWAVVKDGDTYYYPLTAVGSNLQAIVYSGVSVVGFKAVLTTDASGAVGSNGFDASKTFTLDLPFKVDNTASTGIELAENTQYPLTLTLSPNQAVVNLASATGKPGWGPNVQEHEYDNSPNDMFKAAMNELKFEKETNSVGTFEVSGPNGLMVLNKWMTGSITFNKFKSLNFEGATNFTSSYSRLKQNIKLMVDITLPVVAEGESNWTPIGNSQTNYYKGTFDGNNKTLTNLTINSTSDCVGLIGYLRDATVKNLKLKNATVKGKSNVGGIVGYMFSSSEVLNCIVDKGNITATGNYVGGIVGYKNAGTNVISCSTDFTTGRVNVSGQNYVGGIAGYNNGGGLNDCTNSASLIGNYIVGGIVGENQGEVTNCTNLHTITVTNSKYVGGIVGHNERGTVSGCTNQGSVNATSNESYSYVGGIVGYNYHVVEGCFNKGSVQCVCGHSTNYVGGIIGKFDQYSRDTYCAASGNIGSVSVSGTNRNNADVGGLVGYLNSNIYGCWSYVYSNFGYYLGGRETIGCYSNSSKSIINQKVGTSNDSTSGSTISMNKAIGNKSKWKWVVGENVNTDWPTLVKNN